MIEFLSVPWLFPLLIGVIGLLIGSFLNVVIYRVPLQLQQQWQQECRVLLNQASASYSPLNIVYPGSHCPHCKQTLRFYDNLPIFSFIWLKGKCRYCQHGIAWRYPLVEVSSALLAAFMAYQIGLHWQLIPMLILTWGLLCLSFIDFDHQLLPDGITLPLLWLGLILNIIPLFVSVADAVLGASLAYLSLWLLAKVFYLLTKKNGMGQGDFKLLALFGAWLGWQALPMILFLASFLGSMIGIYLILVKKYPRDYPMPFGPFLCIAGWLSLVWAIKNLGI
jgi:leader peptidase (prepilin peptidase)/N-methyltransferase